MNKICLVGNPNCGKTTLYNRLTGKREYTGNRTGVTVEEKSAKYKKDKNTLIIDLPGTYSVKGDAPDERVVTAFLRNFGGVIVNVLDGTNIARNLMLTRELLSLNIPVVLAVNFSDEMEKQGIYLNEKKLGEIIGIPVVKISARKNIGIEKLIKTALETGKTRVVVNGSADFNKVKTVREIEKLLISAIKIEKKAKFASAGDRIDSFLLNGYFGIPVFIGVIFTVYFITSKVGGFIGSEISEVFSMFEKNVYGGLRECSIAPWLNSLVCGAIIKGVGTVLSFIPQVLILFALLSVMEESGYSARIAFLLDGIMRKFGLNGKSLVSFGVSCGCAVSGIMSARSIESESQRKLTVYLCPFMPCSAKVAVFAWLTGLLFHGNALIFTSLYFLSVISIALFGAILERTKRFSRDGYFIMEIPKLRVPSFRAVASAVIEKATDFILKAGSTIFLVSVCVWFLQNFGIHGYTEKITNSFLYYIGNGIRFIFIPLGFGSWQAAIAVISGIFAREAVIETLTVLSANSAGIFLNLRAAYTFMVFILLMPPCVAALSVARKELGNSRSFLYMIGFQFLAAYSVAFSVNAIWFLAEKNFIAFLSLTSIAIGIIISVKILRKSRCRGCGKCAAGEKVCKIQNKANTI